jgi:hypothetical protein
MSLKHGVTMMITQGSVILVSEVKWFLLYVIVNVRHTNRLYIITNNESRLLDTFRYSPFVSPPPFRFLDVLIIMWCFFGVFCHPFVQHPLL